LLTPARIWSRAIEATLEQRCDLAHHRQRPALARLGPLEREGDETPAASAPPGVRARPHADFSTIFQSESFLVTFLSRNSQ
jgi:hypothetical protein